jgi:flagellar motility protein MotE (MotC chaperone)
MIKKVVLIAAAGLVAFAGAFACAWLTSPSAAEQPDQTEPPAVADSRIQQPLVRPKAGMMGVSDQGSAPTKESMTEQQLESLVQSIREKMRDYDDKLKGLQVREKRLHVAQNVLKEDIENLNNLRTELASTVASLKSERDKLLKSRLEIEVSEKVNLVSIAATYDKMDATSASKIMSNMCGEGSEQNTEVDESHRSLDDAAKILYYMTDRTKAKVLAELASSEPSLAAALCNRLKQIVEGE